MEQKVEELRTKKLEEYKISKIADIKDKIDTIKDRTNKEIKTFEEKIEDIKSMKHLESSEGGVTVYWN